MMQQYQELKRRYPDYLLLFRLGDFYEMFAEDAQLGSRLLQITLTARQATPMAGIPHHAADTYIARLIRLEERAFAAKDVPAGKTLDREDVELRRVEADGPAEPVLGVATAVRLRKGAPIGAADLKLKPVVRRGDIVRLVSPAFEVDARALEDGTPGQEIEVEVAASKAKLRGRVAGAGKVEIR